MGDSCGTFRMIGGIRFAESGRFLPWRIPGLDLRELWERLGSTRDGRCEKKVAWPHGGLLVVWIGCWVLAR